MKRPSSNFLVLWLSGCVLVMSLAAAPAAGRRIMSLDGTWQLAEGQADQRPARFDRKVPVPGLADLAQPGFGPDTFKNTKRLFGPEDAALAQRSYWYRREFVIEGEVPAVATLLVRKAAFGSTVYLNGAKVGESLASFTANWYDARAALRGGGATNELVIRVGASRACLPPWVPLAWDYEKKSYIPGLFDSVELALSGTPNIVRVQVAPEIGNKQARVVAQMHNAGSPTGARLKFVVREAKSGKVAGQTESEPQSLATGADKTVEVRIPITDCQLWWPEKPFLYTLEVSSEADGFETRFGMREFRLEPRHGDTPGRAWLNGKLYFMRGSNVALYRFFEDPERERESPRQSGRERRAAGETLCPGRPLAGCGNRVLALPPAGGRRVGILRTGLLTDGRADQRPLAGREAAHLGAGVLPLRSGRLCPRRPDGRFHQGTHPGGFQADADPGGGNQ